MSETAPFVSVSVIVPVYNNAAGLARCLEALEAQTYASDRYEVIVVDNASDEPLAPLIEGYAHARAAYEAAASSYAARNAGLKLAKGEVLAFTDSDCVPVPEWLEKGVEALEKEAGIVIAGGVEAVALDPARPTLIELYETTSGFGQETFPSRGFSATANMIARREQFERVGEFDATLRSGGDAQWGRRATQAGYRFVYVPEARVRHSSRRTLGELTQRLRRLTGGYVETSRRAGRRRLLRWLWQVSHPPLRDSLRVLRDPAMGDMSTRWKFVLIIHYQRVVTCLETYRLVLGLGKPLR